MFNGAETEWSPAFGASWQTPHVELKLPGAVNPFENVAPLSPATPEIVNVFVLKIACPRAIARCCAFSALVNALYRLKMFVLNESGAGLFGSNPTGSLIPI